VRKVILQMMTTLDGFFAGPNGEADWHNVDAEFNEYVISTLSQIDLILFGRVTYELMVNYWPTEHAMVNDPLTAGYMNSLNKIVVSQTLETTDWANTRLIKENIFEEIQNLKQQSGKDIVILGSSSLALILVDLIDEYRFIINPIMLGKGKPMFHGNQERLDFVLINTKTFKSGNIILYYRNDKLC